MILNKKKKKIYAEELQKALDYQHNLRDYNNELFGTDYTTKQALALGKQGLEDRAL